MSTLREFTPGPAPAGRIWLGAVDEPAGVRLFRRCFELPAGASVAAATLRLFADMRYHLWVNGAYLGRGPTLFHPHRRPLHSYEIAGRLRPGRNVLAVLVQSSNLPFHGYIPCGLPGLVAELLVHFNDQRLTLRIASDDGLWLATAATGWLPDTPRRSWAIGPVEAFDMAAAPNGWQNVAFAAAAWQPAEILPAAHPDDGTVFFASDLPKLRFAWQPAKTFVCLRRAAGTTPALSAAMGTGDYGRQLMAEPWLDEPQARLTAPAPDTRGGFTVENLDGAASVAVALDLGSQHTGSVCFILDADSAGTIDIGWAELLNASGRPELLRKNNTYADRFYARPGRNRWQPLNFSAGRYLSFVLRGFRGRLRFRRAGMLSALPDLEWSARFSSCDPLLDGIWRLCARTVACGTQEALMDCPTREQAAYVGDGNPTAAWIARLTGDSRHWRALIRETFAVQRDDGQIKSVVFSGQRHLLLDYSLLALLGVRDYLRATGDLETVRAVLPAGERLLAWYLARIDASGLFVCPWEKLERKAGWVRPPASAADSLQDCGCNIFIDHPGLGWHNKNEPGIDRRGCNASMNALLVLAMRAMAELRAACGQDAAGVQAAAERLAAAAGKCFWNPENGLFADGFLEGARLAQTSQQTNTWCLAAGFPGPAAPDRLLRRLLDTGDRAMARGGPYFWYYMYDEFAKAGMLAEALAETRRLWGGMLQAGATTAWETFAGDELDSLCHPWSSAPADFLLRRIAGLGDMPPGAAEIELRPRPDLLAAVRAQIPAAAGLIRISWRTRKGRVIMQGRLPAGVSATLVWPDGRHRQVSGEWTVARTWHDPGLANSGF